MLLQELQTLCPKPSSLDDLLEITIVLVHGARVCSTRRAIFNDRRRCLWFGAPRSWLNATKDQPRSRRDWTGRGRPRGGSSPSSAPTSATARSPSPPTPTLPEPRPPPEMQRLENCMSNFDLHSYCCEKMRHCVCPTCTSALEAASLGLLSSLLPIPPPPPEEELLVLPTARPEKAMIQKETRIPVLPSTLLTTRG